MKNPTVNRYLKDKAMDHIDHALGRPVDPLRESYRNHFYLCSDEGDLDGQVVIFSRMHLTQDQVKKLLPHLQHFAETGTLPELGGTS